MAWTVLRTVTDSVSYVTAADHNETKANFDIVGGTDGATKTGNWYVSGNVGIGTTSPVAELHVKSSGYGGIFIERRSDAATVSGALWFETSTSGNPYIRASAGDLQIYTGATISVSAGTERLRLTAAGNVGIGTTSPASMLTVAGDVQIAPATGGAYLVIKGVQAGQNAHLYFYTSNAIKWVQYSNDSNSRLYFLDADSNDGVYIAQNATTWTANSDSRLKDVKETIANALDKVNQLTGVKFTWKRDADKPDAKTRVGLIAQDVQAAFPEAVDDDTPDLVTDEVTGKVSGGLGVRYTELIPLLVNAIKELAQRVEALEA